MQNILSWSFSAAGTGKWQRTSDGHVYNGMATVAGSGAVEADGVIEVTNNPADPNGVVTLFTFAATGTGGGNDSAVAQAGWPWARARCTAITGTGAVVEFSLCAAA